MPVNSKKQIDFNISYQQNYYCQVRINDTPLIPGNIISLIIREWAFELVPRFHLIFQDDGLFSEISTLQDLDKITIEIARTPDTDKTFQGEFCVIDWKCNVLADNRLHIIEVTGLLNTPSLYYPIKTRSFSNKTSIDTIKTIANECNLIPKERNGFTKSIDTMTWLQIGQTNLNFIKHVSSKSFKNKDGILIYCNSKKELNITSLNTELNKMDEISAKYNPMKFSENVLSEEDQNILWYANYDYINTNGYLNQINNYGTGYNYYDLEKNIINKYNDNSHKYSELGFKNKNAYNSLSNWNIFGIQSNNVHKNFLKAISQNSYFIKNFFGFSLVLNVHASIKVNLMDTILLTVPSLPYIDPNSINELLSGKYLVGGIVYIIGKGQGFQKQISLHRNGMNKSIFQEEYNI